MTAPSLLVTLNVKCVNAAYDLSSPEQIPCRQQGLMCEIQSRQIVSRFEERSSPNPAVKIQLLRELVGLERFIAYQYVGAGKIEVGADLRLGPDTIGRDGMQ